MSFRRESERQKAGKFLLALARVRRTTRARRRLTFDRLETRELLATFTVKSTNDSGDYSLRWAINQANASPGGDVIKFDIPSHPPYSGVETIELKSALPAIKGAVTIDGYTQTGAKANTLGPGQGDNAIILVQITAAAGAGFSGLVVGGGHGTVIEGLSLVGFSKGAGIALKGGRNTRIVGDFLGLKPNGDIPSARNGIGVEIDGPQGNTIGGLANADRNLISGNLSQGIKITGNTNLVINDMVGTDNSGTGARPNGGQGIVVANASNDTIGGTAPAAGNLISGNATNGIEISAGGANPIIGNRIGTNFNGTNADPNGQDGILLNAANGTIVTGNLISGNSTSLTYGGIAIGAGLGLVAQNNVVSGNTIGLTITESAPLGNAGFGVQIQNNASKNTIGGSSASAANVISGNQGDGINQTTTAGTFSQNYVYSNDIGTDRTGTAALGNGGNGISVMGAGATLFVTSGGSLPQGNVIDANKGSGVFVGSGGDAVVTANLIGVASDGSTPLGNAGRGVFLNASSAAVIGANVISGNALHGVDVYQTNGFVQISANTIGLNKQGTAAVPNGQDGVIVNGSSGVVINGNIISGNGSQGGWGGVDIGSGQASTNTTITRNSIGVDENGSTAFGNQGFGIRVSNASTGTTIGGTVSSLKFNVISGNQGDGILLLGGLTVVLGNDIGINQQQTAALPNRQYGVEIRTPNATIGGTAAGVGNIIAGNIQGGVLATNFSGAGVVIQGNTIGTTPAGTAGLGNAFGGVAIFAASGVTVGGTTAGAGNTISGNGLDGIFVGRASNTAIQGNRIGTNPAGTAALPNTGNGINATSNQSVVDVTNMTIGGTAAGAGNVISGNQKEGIALRGVGQSVIQGNLIGASASGQSAIGNQGDGIGPSGPSGSIGSITIGGTTAGAGNTISGNGGNGIIAATGMLIQGNSIGTTGDGTAALGNGADGVYVSGAVPTIGGTTAAAGNVISGNVKNGVEVVSPQGPVSIGYNLIGTNAAGTSAVPNAVGIVDSAASDPIVGNVISGNTGAGLLMNNASGANVSGNSIGLNLAGTGTLANAVGVSIGGTIQAANTLQGNVISGNTGDGVLIQTALQKLVQNTIGIAATGSAIVSNGLNGVEISGAAATGNVIGTPGLGNVISGNAGAGVLLGGDSGTLIQGNIIGLDSTGSNVQRNRLQGISLNSGSTNDTIGGTTQGAGNVISGNGQTTGNAGVLVGGTSSGTLIQGNIVGLNAKGTASASNAVGVYVQGSASGTTIGGTATGAGNTIGGNGSDGVLVSGSAAGTLIQGDTIGLGSGGTAIGNGYDGVELMGGTGTTIGGTTAAARNVISGNGTSSLGGSGIYVNGSSVTGTLIVGDFIGTDPTGTRAAGNTDAGITVYNTTATIGGTGGGRNIISGNAGDGVYLNAAENVSIVNDLIGLNAAGNAAVANGSAGIEAYNAEGTTIGGLTGLSDFISGNTADGVLLDGGTTTTTIQGNTIGLAGGAAQKLANGGAGINVTDTASSTTIGGSTLGAGNIISGNTGSGINVAAGTNSTLIQGDKIGTDVSTNNVLANGGDGITIAGGGATVGGTTAGATNVIAGNAGNGIAVNGTPAANDLIQGNDIGTDATGTLARGNALNGILVSQAGGVTIGGTVPGADNLISANQQNGIQVVNGNGTLIQGNEIGTDVSGTLSLANGKSGVQLTSSGLVTIGGSVAGGGNVISGNTLDGIQLSVVQATLITGNLIGTNLSGNAAVANGGQGIDLIGATTQTTIGQVGFGNVISGNAGDGVLFTNQALLLTLVANDIGVNRNGTGPVANAIGVELAGNTAVIGTGITGQGNIISSNLGNGVQVDGTARGITVQGDQIGLNGADGIVVNSASGVSIGGTSAGQGNVVSSNAGNGIHLASATGVSILNNLVGTSSSGMLDQGNQLDGILLYSSLNNTIGGNVISGNDGNGIELTTSSTRNAIASNKIGVGSDGVSLMGNNGYGVFVQNDSSSNTIGGTTPGMGNTIGGNLTGVVVGDSTTDNSQADSILGNAIYANSDLGIDLGEDGVTPNHIPPFTSGPNLLQNYPVLATAMNSSGGGLTITGTLSSVANRTYRVEFFSQATGDPSGYGQGQTYLGYATVTTNGSGVATINVNLAGVNIPVGQAITATATDPSGNTSEFSAWITTSPGPSN